MPDPDNPDLGPCESDVFDHVWCRAGDRIWENRYRRAVSAEPDPASERAAHREQLHAARRATAAGLRDTQAAMDLVPVPVHDFPAGPSVFDAEPNESNVQKLARMLQGFRAHKHRAKPMMPVDLTAPLTEVRVGFFALLAQRRLNKPTGAVTVVCPTCLRPDTIERRALDSGEAGVLCRMFLHKGAVQDRWMHVDDIGQKSRSEGKLRDWGLLEQRSGKRADGNPNKGEWRLSELGLDFVQGRCKVGSHMVDAHGSQRWIDQAKMIYIWEVPNFHWEKMMRGE